MNSTYSPSACARTRSLLKLSIRTYRVETKPRSRQPDFAAIDAKWQQRWRDAKQWELSTADKGKFYVLPMFPYPSGALHIGHLRNYTISDAIARYRRMKGYNVLHPIGWDAFGLPAENAAIERGVNPAEWTSGNICAMKQQLHAMGGCWDWDKELSTCDPDFYKDTQALFLKLYKHGLAYQADATVNYDPLDRTVLANEQVDMNGCSWRSGAKVEKINLRQWFIRITDYAPDLLDSLKELEKQNNWPQQVVAMQRNWLGKSEGALLRFDIHQSEAGHDGSLQERVDVFTTRPDTLFGVQFVALSLDHPIVKRHAKVDTNLKAFIHSAALHEHTSKAGYRIKDFVAENPLKNIVTSGASFSGLPVFAAPYVRSDYAHGAIMGVPAHDERDFEFWAENRRNGDESPHHVIERHPLKENSFEASGQDFSSVPFTGHGILSARCQQYQGMSSIQAAKRIINDLMAYDPKIAKSATQWRLRDWLVSRQRYWGTPIPIIHCKTCGTVPVPEGDLPVELPSLNSTQWKERRGNPLEKLDDWRHVACPKCGGAAERETDTMDTFVDSSWYYLKFAKSAARSRPATSFMPADLYIGGVEHAILHLLYARFISKVLSKTDPTSLATGEPFSKLITQGMVHGRTFTDPGSGKFLRPEEVQVSDLGIPEVRTTGQPAVVSFEKMSKSKHNGIDPSECVRKYGADITRAHLLFLAPVSEVLNWDEDKITGIQRWFGRVWQLVQSTWGGRSDIKSLEQPIDISALENESAELWKRVQQTIVSTDRSLSSTYTLNTIVSDLMTLTNDIQRASEQAAANSTPWIKPVVEQSLNVLLRLMTPIAPSFAEECWWSLHSQYPEDIQFNPSHTASRAGFPEVDGSLEKLQARLRPCALQVNGKLKLAHRITSPPDGTEGKDLEAWILQRIAETKEGAEIFKRWNPVDARRVVVARSGRTVNLVF